MSGFQVLRGADKATEWALAPSVFCLQQLELIPAVDFEEPPVIAKRARPVMQERQVLERQVAAWVIVRLGHLGTPQEQMLKLILRSVVALLLLDTGYLAAHAVYHIERRVQEQQFVQSALFPVDPSAPAASAAAPVRSGYSVVLPCG